MSGIAGAWHLDGRPGAADQCAGTLRALRVYGPHACDVSDAGEIALGRCLFRTLPEDSHDAQPLTGGDGRWIMVADIRLDNRHELGAALGLPEALLRVMADSAIVMAAWERWQEAGFDRLIGDFAIGVWDRDTRRLVLARDAMGARPLFYHRAPRLIAFASMAKGLHALPGIARMPDVERVVNELALLPDFGAQSFFAGIDRVEPGHFVVMTGDTTTSHRFWNPRPAMLRLANPEAYAEALREQLDRAVAARLRGAREAVGTHLSGGFDSSAVTTSAATQMAARDGAVVAYTAAPRLGFAGLDPRNRFGDETPMAARTAAMHANIEHVVVRNGGASPLANLERHFDLFERPVFNLCNQNWLDAISEAARARGLGVMLTGHMGNMTISYDGMTLLPLLIRQGRWLRWLEEGRALMRASAMRGRGLLAASFGPYLPSAAWAWLNRNLRGESDWLGTHAMLGSHVDRAAIGRRARERGLDLAGRPGRDGFRTRLWSLQRRDRGNSIKGVLGGWGLDMRDPTSDRRLVEFSLSIPEDQFLRDGDTKALARRAFASRLPAELIGSRGKGLQAADWYERLASDRQTAHDEIARIARCDAAARTLDITRMAELVRDWPESGWEREEVQRRYRFGLLRGISSGHFLRKASEGE